MGYYTNQMLVEFLYSIKEKMKQKSAEKKKSRDRQEKQGKNPPDASL